MLLRREQRRLAAIVSADVAGYSRLMGRDESGTLAALKALRRDVVDPPISAHGGRIVKTTGDGLLLEFPSVVDAVRCVIEVQTAVAAKTAGIPEDRRIAFRVGVNLGDIIIDGDDIFGDGVNIAARLEALSEPGGACLSDDAFRQVRGKIDASFVEIGAQALKNIAQPVHVWCWTRGGMSIALAPALALPAKPSIAVLPFQNMSGDPDQEYFADGMTEDILTALSRFQNLFVIARNSSFTYKGRSVDIKQVGKELGVRYVLEGSVRAAANRVRITTQLIDATSGHHVWADRYDRALTDIFAVQDEVTSRIVAAIDFEVRAVEAQRPAGVASAGLEAWARYHQAFPLLFRLTEEENQRAAHLFDALRTSHPNLAVAHAGYGYARSSEVIYGWTADRVASARAAIAPCRKAVELDDKDAFCHQTLGRALLLAGDRDLGLASLERAVARNPNFALAHLFRGVALAALDRDAEALADIDLAIRLSPRDPGLWSFYFWQGRCHRDLGNVDAAVSSLRQAIGERPDVWFPHLDLSTTLAGAGRMDEAKAAITKARDLNPHMTLDAIAYLDSLFMSPRRVEENQRCAAALGVPKSIDKAGADAGALPLPDKPSIAVLPFQNMSGDSEQEYFVDGLVEDIITALSRFRSLFVIARNSSFTYKGKVVDIKQVGRELGVRYVLEGSVRKAGGRVRIIGQLIEAASGSHLWADKFDGSLEDIFELQDQVTTSVVTAIAPKITQAEMERARRKPIGSLDAYDLFLRGIALYEQKRTFEGHTEARKLFERAIELDPYFSTPYAMIARFLSTSKLHGWPTDPEQSRVQVRQLAERVAALGNDDAHALAATGFALAWVCQDFDAAAAFVDRAIAANPNLGIAWTNRAMVSTLKGEHVQAIEQFERARRISPIGPDYYLTQGYLGYCHMMMGHNDEAIRFAADAASHQPNWLVGHLVLASVHGLTGNIEAARRSLAEVRRLNPKLRVSNADEIFWYPDAPVPSPQTEGLRLAGLPE